MVRYWGYIQLCKGVQGGWTYSPPSKDCGVRVEREATTSHVPSLNFFLYSYAH